jgi:hypothetical protein
MNASSVWKYFKKVDAGLHQFFHRTILPPVILESDTGPDPYRIFPDPDPEIRDFLGGQDFPGLRIFPD